MKIVYFDSGTTNTRIFVLIDGKVVYTDKETIGSKDSALARDPMVLVKGLKRLYDRVLAALSLCDADIDAVYLSGMVSCPSGIHEVEHIPLPAGKEEIQKRIVEFSEEVVFKRHLYIVPGLKTIPQGVKVQPQEAVAVNNMRGEEIEILGVLYCCEETFPPAYLLLMPGSHTQVAVIRDGKIVDLISCVTGELFAAITKETIIGSSVVGGKTLVPAMARLGCKILKENGFNRALYTVRSMELFSDTSPDDRKSLLEGILNAGIAQAVHAKLESLGKIRFIAVYGSAYQTDVLKLVFEEFCPGRYTIEQVRQHKEPMSVYGMLNLLRP